MEHINILMFHGIHSEPETAVVIINPEARFEDWFQILTSKMQDHILVRD
jgi:hypothetical protein